MNEEIDDSEFYHEDFTTASDWEILVAHMEEIINQWKLDDMNQETPKYELLGWKVRAEKLVYIDMNFDFVWYKREAQIHQSDSTLENPKHVLDKWYDFSLKYGQSEAHKDVCLSEWYGLNEFIVLSSAGKIELINNEPKTKILLSALTVLVSNLLLDIPLFVQLQDKWQKVYAGVYESNGIRTNFDIVHLKKGLYYCQYLTGLLDLFKTKICSPCAVENIFVSCQLTYLLQDFGNFVWRKEISGDSIDVENLYVLPFGVSIEPVSAICFKTTWSNLSEHSVIDTESQTNFNPMKAQKWQCSAFFEKEPICLLSECLGEFLEILNNFYTVYDVLGDFAVSFTPENNPLDLLTESSVPTISSLLGRAAKSHFKRHGRGNPPIQENVLVPLLYFLFPDADENSYLPYGVKNRTASVHKKNEVFQNSEEEFKGFKTGTEDSLIWRLSIVLSNALQTLGGIRAFCHIWYEFVQEMRYRWEHSMVIPGVTSGMPDLRTCLLNQKLQMLNCCLERKIAREGQRFASAENSEDSDEEFFDANDDVDDEKKREKFPDKPVGRLSKFGDMKLLNSDEPLYIPLTQDPVLKTEDQLEADTDILLKLGSDSEASELRARIMSASLLSDMESFKAANPGSILEDFIRWYSPRDWIEGNEVDEKGQTTGYLSPRMQMENNIWKEMWQSARPIPANRQKRLFDDTREAEKVLQYLDLMGINQIAELVIPTLSHIAICRLIDELESLPNGTPDQFTRISNLVKQGERLSRETRFQPKRFELFIQDVTFLEMQISQIYSLQYKLNPQSLTDVDVNNDISEIALRRNINIEDKENSLIGSRIMAMFNESQRRLSQSERSDSSKAPDTPFPIPHQKEFVLRTDNVRPSLHSAKSPQFLRAILGKNEFRLIGAFSEDTTFF
ncbi:rab3 GTPase-activating protein catalytic subunit [Euwallacea similis]|uniref:rab3 GTPase-activating protein catalytic subunit n=1 Tax=Euwallacea similis TaxID=1736056 RepID=UPI00344E628F